MGVMSRNFAAVVVAVLNFLVVGILSAWEIYTPAIVLNAALVISPFFLLVGMETGVLSGLVAVRLKPPYAAVVCGLLVALPGSLLTYGSSYSTFFVFLGFMVGTLDGMVLAVSKPRRAMDHGPLLAVPGAPLTKADRDVGRGLFSLLGLLILLVFAVPIAADMGAAFPFWMLVLILADVVALAALGVKVYVVPLINSGNEKGIEEGLP